MTDGPTFLRDRDWSGIDGEICLVEKFVTLAGTVRDGKVESFTNAMPYAAVDFRCPRVDGLATGFITHKTDFEMLWNAFHSPRDVDGVHMEVVAPIPEDHEVWFVWTTKQYRWGVGLVKAIMPKLTVMICPKGAYELITNRALRPELTGMERHNAIRPVVTWTPGVKHM